MTIESTDARGNHGISRRRLVQGAAWATPAILIATSAPAAASSTVVEFGLTAARTDNEITSGAVTYDVPAGTLSNLKLYFEIQPGDASQNDDPFVSLPTGWSYTWSSPKAFTASYNLSISGTSGTIALAAAALNKFEFSRRPNSVQAEVAFTPTGGTATQYTTGVVDFPKK
ncbi:hypothetical protein [Demequina rhizosphaerae]|uniref:hypothetical protein n=1 Tax=Demequina rhizosphaerae TaxID=1638985 RepID=UPI00078444A6|nr:hypothetical protein [Demequina rhizosphaerae]